MPTPFLNTRKPFRSFAIALVVVLHPATAVAPPSPDDLGDIVERTLDDIAPPPPTLPPPTTPSQPPPPPRPPSPSPSTSLPAASQSPTSSTSPIASSVPAPVGETPIAPDEPASADRHATAAPERGSTLLPLACGVGFAAAALAAARHRRLRTRTPTPRDRHDHRTQPGTTRSRVPRRDESNPMPWIQNELRLLANSLSPEDRRRVTIQLVQLGADHRLEIAFTEVVDIAPPASWTSAADRVWQLDQPHDHELIDPMYDLSPILPTLVPIGKPADCSRLYLNLESAGGINISGDDDPVRDWLANAIWEIAGQALGEGSVVRVVADDHTAAFSLPDVVERIDETEALDLVQDTLQSGPVNQSPSMLDRRTGRWEAWPSSTFLLLGEPNDERWDRVAASPSIAVLSTTYRFESGLDVTIRDGTISIPSLGIGQPAAAMTRAKELTIEGVMDSVGIDSAKDAFVVFEPTDPPTPPTSVEEEEEGWQPPTWPVMVNVLGVPHATKNGASVKLTPQQLSALALIAMKREIPVHDFRRSIWGDEDDVSPERVRDMLSQLRKKVGGLRVIPKREDGMVCAGDDLGSDTLAFEAFVARSASVPTEKVVRLREALDLVTGRVMDYSSSDSAWWRWSEIAFGATDWTMKTTDVASSLAQCYLESSEPAAARDVAERGLVADPLNASLTELLMEAYADLGTLETAQRVYESHDRSLDMADLGGASPETRRVLQRLRAAADRAVDEESKVS